MSRVDRLRTLLGQASTRMMQASVLERLMIAVGSTGLALLFAIAIVVATGHDPYEFLYNLLYGSFGTESRLGQTLRHTTFLILAGLAVAIAFRANVFNIGVQGQLVVGAFTGAMTILLLAPVLPDGALGGTLLMGLAIVAGAIGGGAYAALPGLMKAYAEANEVITTIMLNFIAIGVLFTAVDGPLKDPESPAPRTVHFPDYVEFPQVVFTTGRFSLVALIVALFVVVIAYFVVSNTPYGFDLRTSGRQAAAAAYSGVIPERMIVSTMTLSGMVAGITGTIYVIMTLDYFGDPNGYPTYGFDAIAVSLLGANNPLGVVPAGLLFGSLESGGQFVNVATDVPAQLVEGVVGLIVLFVAAPEMFRMGRRYLSRGDDS